VIDHFADAGISYGTVSVMFHFWYRNLGLELVCCGHSHFSFLNCIIRILCAFCMFVVHNKLLILQSVHCECFSDVLTHVSTLSLKLLDLYEQFAMSCSVGSDFVTQFSALAFDNSCLSVQAVQPHSAVSWVWYCYGVRTSLYLIVSGDAYAVVLSVLKILVMVVVAI